MVSVLAVTRQSLVKMVRGKPLSEDLRKSIICAHNDGISGCNIAKNLRISRYTVRNIIRLFKKEGNVTRKVRTGRISKITKRDRRVLRNLIRQDRRVSSRELASKWGNAIQMRVSKDTCLRHLKTMGYGFYKVCFVT